jgi:hypothetical protein
LDPPEKKKQTHGLLKTGGIKNSTLPLNKISCAALKDYFLIKFNFKRNNL